MVNIYDSIRNENGDIATGRTKLFIISTEEDGTIRDFLDGYAIVPESKGTLFITDEHVVDQIDKLQFKDGSLTIKEYEEIIPPIKSEKQIQIEELERQLAAMKAGTEEPTDMPTE